MKEKPIRIIQSFNLNFTELIQETVYKAYWDYV